MTKIDPKISQQLETRLQEIFAFFDLDPKITMAIEDGVLIIDVTTTKDDLFIGRSPDPLLGLQHLLRLVVKHDFPEDQTSLSLNIGGFHQQQRNRLADIAKDAAAQARNTGTAVYLDPMSSFERRLVHLALTQEDGVTSESDGVGSDRRVVVKPEKT